MPFGAAGPWIFSLPGIVGSDEEIRLAERQLMRADEEGMVERFITLEGIKEPRMLSWAELRALRADRVVWSHSDRLADWEGSAAAFKREYQQNWEPPKICRCGAKRVASVSKMARLRGQPCFHCFTCELPIYGEERY